MRSNAVNQINMLGDELGGAHHLISLDPQEMLESAMQSTGLMDFGTHGWDIGYNSLVNSINHHNSFHTIGALKTKIDIILTLRNRLLIIDEIKNNPKILDEKIESPIFIIGNPRTGTSILFELFSQDTSLRAPLTWETNFPISQSKFGQKNLSKALNGVLNSLQPRIKSMHEFKWNLPAECFLITRMNFFNVGYGFENHEEWINNIRPIDNYLWHKLFLQLLQSKSKKKRQWVLKCPFHLHFIKYIYDVYPDAKIVYTHRDPAKSICSSLNLFRTLQSSVSSQPAEAGINYSLMKRSIKYIIDERKTGNLKNKEISDIKYLEFLSNPISSIVDAYSRIGLKLNSGSQKRMLNYLKMNPQHKNGKYTNKPDEFNLSEESIRNEFKFYINHYKIQLE